MLADIAMYFSALGVATMVTLIKVNLKETMTAKTHKLKPMMKIRHQRLVSE